MEVVIANDSRDELFADIGFEHYYWAEVIYDTSQRTFVITIFKPPEEGDQYIFRLSDVQEALERAKRRLMERGYGNTNGEGDIA